MLVFPLEQFQLGVTNSVNKYYLRDFQLFIYFIIKAWEKRVPFWAFYRAGMLVFKYFGFVI